MPKRTGKAETIIYKDIAFRRYPESPNWSDSNYYRPNSVHIKRGVKALHIEIWQDAHGLVPEGCHIHHRDGDTSNNALDNLECLTAELHAQFHSEHYSDERRERARRHIEEIRPLASAWHKSDEGRAWHRIIGGMAYDNAEVRTYICERCGNEFRSRDFRSERVRFCSNNCKAYARRDSGVDNETRRCKRCNTEFGCNRYVRKEYCSPGCKPQSQRRREERHCEHCGETFETFPSSKKRFCKPACAYSHMYPK